MKNIIKITEVIILVISLNFCTLDDYFVHDSLFHNTETNNPLNNFNTLTAEHIHPTHLEEDNTFRTKLFDGSANTIIINIISLPSFSLPDEPMIYFWQPPDLA